MSQTQLDRVQPDAIASNGNAKSNLPSWRSTPQLDLYESDSEYLLLVDMPGASADSLKVQVTGRALELSAQSVPHLMDVATTQFERRVELPADVDASSASAQLQNGVLEVRISKAASARRVKIPVSTN